MKYHLITYSRPCSFKCTSNRSAIGFIRALLVISILLTYSHYVHAEINTNMLTSAEEQNDTVRLCRQTDLPGYWMMVDQAITDWFRAEKPDLESEPTFFPYQFMAFYKDGTVRDVVQRSYTPSAEEELRREAPILKKKLDYLKKVPASLVYQVDEEGILAWINRENVRTSTVLCNKVLGQMTFPGENAISPKRGDLIFGTIGEINGRYQIAAMQLFRRMQIETSK